ncbi:hypothetical protein EDB87DRAFT_1738828, partial [Lactarius vividus]
NSPRPRRSPTRAGSPHNLNHHQRPSSALSRKFPLTDWPQSAPQSNEAPPPLENDNIFFSMPGFENEPLQQPSSLLAELFGTDLPGVFQLQGFESPRLTARPPGSIDLGVGNYPPGMCGSSAFDDALRSLGEDPTTFMANPTADELLAAISMLSPQENNDPLSSWLSSDRCDFGGSALPQPPAAGEPAAAGHAHPVETPSSESLAEPKPHAVVLRHDPVASLGSRAIPAAASGSASAVGASAWRGERGWAPGRRQLESPAGGLAARVRVADPQLRVFAQAGSRVIPPSSLPSIF